MRATCPRVYMRPLRLQFLAALLSALACVRGVPAAPAADALPPAPAELRIVSYNTYNFWPLSKPQIKSVESRQMVVSVLHNLDPDMAVLIEIGGADALKELVELLAKAGTSYPFTSMVQGEDPDRNICIISKWKPVLVKNEEMLNYNLFGRAVRVQRGFAHLVFEWANGYRLHLLGAHLKSKLFDARGQTDMRRYEARLLRYQVTDILKTEKDANVLVVGDLNDSPDSSPLNTLCDRRAKARDQLFDLRPVDKYNQSWSHLQDESDAYSRIDYTLASYGLLPEVVWEKTLIPFLTDWYIASDHRPLLVTLTPTDKPFDEKLIERFDRNIRQALPMPSSFHDGPVSGTRKARKAAPASGENP